MKLIWKLLRHHISVAQLAGFFLANLCGMVIVLLGIQFYNDVLPIFTQSDSFLKKDYIVVSKKVSTLGSFLGRSNQFSNVDIEEVKEQPFTESVGPFTSSHFQVSAGLGIEGIQMSTAMFFESVPDEFVDIETDKWRFTPGDGTIPIIIPRNYLNLYNFGFAQSRSLPQISEGLMGTISLDIRIAGKGKRDNYKGRIVGFSNRLNTILVPDAFMKWANTQYAEGKQKGPSRLIIEVNNPTDERIARFFEDKGYETENDKLDNGKAAWFLRIIVGIVLSVGLVISILSLYILMLSIFLLLQKNTYKLENLLLIGYSTRKVAFPYQAMTVLLNGLVLVLSTAIVLLVRHVYSNLMDEMGLPIDTGAPWLAIGAGIVLFLIVSAINTTLIYRKMKSLF
ncbi:MAG: ABC transporter permease [Bacteroidaceae bacterium]|nr:ABC transporter permease [Bacteroidaceae bacterium]